jgi:large conductance mechanosensitive channel
MRGFKNLLMQGELIVIAVGLVVALAFSTLIKAFAVSIITPLVNAAGGGGTTGLRRPRQGTTDQLRRINLGGHLLRDLHGRHLLRERYALPCLHRKAWETAFGDPAPTTSCPFCLSATAVGLPDLFCLGGRSLTLENPGARWGKKYLVERRQV